MDILYVVYSYLCTLFPHKIVLICRSERVVTLESTISDMEQQLAEKADEVTSVAEHQERTASALQETQRELSKQVQSVQKQLDSAREEGLLLQEKVSAAETALIESQKKLSQSEGEFYGDVKALPFTRKFSRMHALARCLELDATRATVEKDLQSELSALRESALSIKVELENREAALTGALEQVAGAETTIKEWESKQMVISD